MADEPTNGELGRRLEEINRNLHGLIGQAQYGADQRRYDDRLDTFRRELTETRSDFDKALVDVRADFEKAITAVHTRISDEAKRSAENRQGWRQILYTGLVPAFVVFLSILVQIWLHGGTK